MSRIASQWNICGEKIKLNVPQHFLVDNFVTFSISVTNGLNCSEKRLGSGAVLYSVIVRTTVLDELPVMHTISVFFQLQIRFKTS